MIKQLEYVCELEATLKKQTILGINCCGGETTIIYPQLTKTTCLQTLTTYHQCSRNGTPSQLINISPSAKERCFPQNTWNSGERMFRFLPFLFHLLRVCFFFYAYPPTP